MTLDQFAARCLFAQVGITEFRWRHAPNDRATGEGNLFLSARDVAAIGHLFLDSGSRATQRLVSRSWTEDSLSNHVAIETTDPYADTYGYMWYSRTIGIKGRSVSFHFASGNGGNKVYIVPSANMVVAITSSAYNMSYGRRRSQDIFTQILSATRPFAM